MFCLNVRSRSSSSQIWTLIKNLVFGFSQPKSARKLLCNTLLDFRSKLVAFKQVLCYSLLQLSNLKGTETHTYYTQFCWWTLLSNFLPRQIWDSYVETFAAAPFVQVGVQIVQIVQSVEIVQSVLSVQSVQIVQNVCQAEKQLCKYRSRKVANLFACLLNSANKERNHLSIMMK